MLLESNCHILCLVQKYSIKFSRVIEGAGLSVFAQPRHLWRVDGNTRSINDEDAIPVVGVGHTEAECEVTLAGNMIAVYPPCKVQLARAAWQIFFCQDDILQTPPLLPGPAMVGSDLILLDVTQTPTFRKVVLLMLQCANCFLPSLTSAPVKQVSLIRQGPELAAIATEAGTHPSYVSHSALRETVVKNELVVTFCFDLSVDKTTRKLGVKGIESFLKELKWNSNVATVYAFSDFPYTANLPLIEQEYLKLSRETFAVPGLAGKDGFIILNVHYSGKWRASDTQAVFDEKRSVITQINGHHTWDDNNDMRY